MTDPKGTYACPVCGKSRFFQTPSGEITGGQYGGRMCAVCTPPRHLPQPVIVLDTVHVDYAMQVARQRWDWVLEHKAHQPLLPHGAPSLGSPEHVGVLGEIVASIALGLPIRPSLEPDHERGDLAGIHVRATSHPGGSLIVHPDDPDDAPFLLVRRMDPRRWQVTGWSWGQEAKAQRFWREDVPLPAFFVPDDALNGVDTLWDGMVEVGPGLTFLPDVWHQRTARRQEREESDRARRMKFDTKHPERVLA